MEKIKKRKLVLKTRNSGKMTEAAFFGWIRSRLRKMSVAWIPISDCKKDCRIPYVGDNNRRKWSYICSNCKTAIADKEGAVHHLNPCGTLKSFQDLPDFCERLFVEKEGLIFLCHQCHSEEHVKLKENE